MTPEEKKEIKRLYDIEYRKTNAINIAKVKKTKYLSLSEEERSTINKIKYASLDKEKKKKDDKDYASKNKTALNKKKKDWAIVNKEKVKKAKSDYVRKKLNTDVLYRLKHNIGCGIRQSFKRNGFTKNSKSFIILGCTYEEFKLHIESKFKDWMSWDNYGKVKTKLLIPNIRWDIDHIIPISTAKTEEDVIRLNHYTNLQPLCSYVNQLVKKNNI